MTTKEFIYFDDIQDVDIEENLTEEELKSLEIETAKAISKKECSDKNINVSFIVLNELRSIGFKNDLSTDVVLGDYTFISTRNEDKAFEKHKFSDKPEDIKRTYIS